MSSRSSVPPSGLTPQRGEQLGAGASCRVYAWGADRVVKVYRRGFESLAQVEYERAGAIHRAGVPSPAVHGVVTVEGRAAVVFDRIDGPSLLDELLAGNRTTTDVGRTIAELHGAIHDLPVAGLPHLADTLHERGVNDSPRGVAAFHGDFHPGNIITSGDQFVVIDWSNAHVAPPAADVACTMLAIGYRGLRADHPDLDRRHRSRLEIADAYLEAYGAVRPAVLDDVPYWFATIGRLLLEQEPDTAGADELRATWAQRTDE